MRSNGKKDYLATLKIGSIVAFKTSDGKVKSAKVSDQSDMVVIEVTTSYGEKHQILEEDILWVKTGKRWPKGIYNLFKGEENE